jgi:hypothetical protein
MNPPWKAMSHPDQCTLFRRRQDAVVLAHMSRRHDEELPSAGNVQAAPESAQCDTIPR